MYRGTVKQHLKLHLADFRRQSVTFGDKFNVILLTIADKLLQHILNNKLERDNDSLSYF